MKSLAELEEIRQKTLDRINMRNDPQAVRIVVGMATCGMAAGARPVMAAFTDEAAKRNLTHVSVSQTGCIGLCKYEPLVDIYMPGKEKVTYIHMNPEKAARVLEEHVIGGQPVAEYTIDAAMAK